LGEPELFAAGFDGQAKGELEGWGGRHPASFPLPPAVSMTSG
jgi:hypothetical protein